MLWFIVFGVLVLAAIAVLVAIGVWLVRKVADLSSEVRAVGEQAGRLADLVAQIKVPEHTNAAHAEPVADAADHW